MSNNGFRTTTILTVLLISAVILSLCSSSSLGQNTGLLDLKRGDPVPVIKLKTLDGKDFDSSKLSGTTLVVLFGDVNMLNTQTVCRRLGTMLTDKDQFGNDKVMLVLILSGHTVIEEARSKIAETPKIWPDIILHDSERMAFENYEVTVLPSTVVIDGEGKVVHAVAGLMPMYYEIIANSVLLSTGKIDDEQFEQRINPPQHHEITPEEGKADRAVKLAGQLIKHNIIEGAIEQYLKAIQLVPEHIEAHLGLANLYMSQGDYDAAQSMYEKALEIKSSLLEAKLGLASISILTSEPGDLTEVKEYLEQIIAKDKKVARAHYLLGCIYEKRNETEQAAAAYKLAAEILMEQQAISDK